jgi:tellurite resistance protein
MATWVGALARGGLLFGREEEEGAELAVRLLGEDALMALREHFASQPPPVIDRERSGAVRACIYMAQADRELADAEIELLAEIIAHSDLSMVARRELEAAIRQPQDAQTVASELTQPGLRELILALGWMLAKADGRIDEEEQRAHLALAEAFGIGPARVAEIAALIGT